MVTVLAGQVVAEGTGGDWSVVIVVRVREPTEIAEYGHQTRG